MVQVLLEVEDEEERDKRQKTKSTEQKEKDKDKVYGPNAGMAYPLGLNCNNIVANWTPNEGNTDC